MAHIILNRQTYAMSESERETYCHAHTNAHLPYTAVSEVKKKVPSAARRVKKNRPDHSLHTHIFSLFSFLRPLPGWPCVIYSGQANPLVYVLQCR